jgi:hypothetical protein
MLNVKEFRDFSGGITDKNIPGQENLYSVADNMLIDHDKQLFQRGGLDIFSSTAFKLGGSQIVQRLVNFDFDTELLGLQNKNLYYISGGAWTSLLGPTTHNPFPNNVAGSKIEESQWNHHAFFVSDSGDWPIKYYRDGSNNPQLRTAGLPKVDSTVRPVDGGLADAISLANDIRLKMITHTASNAAVAGTTPFNSATKHHVSNATLTAENANVTASVAATNLATLITLMNVLRDVYASHIGDAQKEIYPATRASHVAPDANQPYQIQTALAYQPNYEWHSILNLSLINPTYVIPAAAKIAEVVTYVNDLKDKWNWHNWAPLTHWNAFRYNTTEYYVGLGAHVTSVASVSTYTWAKISPQYDAFIQYVKDIYAEYAYHLASSDSHLQHDTINAIPSGYNVTPTTFQDALTLLGAMGFFFYLHMYDAEFAVYKQYTADSTLGSNILTNVSPAPSAPGILVPIYGDGATPYTWSIPEGPLFGTKYNPSTAVGATTITLTATLGANLAAKQFLFTTGNYHLGKHVSRFYKIEDYSKEFNEQDYSLSTVASLQGFSDLANTLALALKAHAISNKKIDTNSPQVQIRNIFIDRYTPDDVTQTNGENFTNHMGNVESPTNNPNSDAPRSIFYFPASILGGKEFTNDWFDAINKPTAVSYNYKLLFKYDYLVGALEFQDLGATSEPINIISIESPRYAASDQAKYGITLTNIFSYTDTANDNYALTDTTNFTKEIYRTLANGTVYYKVNLPVTAGVFSGSISNATTSYTDISLDINNVNNETLYTTGGVISNQAAPKCKHLHILDGIGYYANIILDSNGDTFKNRLMQSKVQNPTMVPATFYDDFDEEITGLSSTRSNLIVFCKKSVYREEGNFDDRGNGVLKHERISDQIGCISSQSIVKGESGVFFAGQDGFYYTDGYQILRLTGELEATFKTITTSAAQKSALQGTYDGVNKKVYWIVQSTSALTAPDKMWVLDLQFGIKKDATPITTFSGFTPTAVTFYNSLIHYGDSDGYTMKIDDTLNLDVKKNTAVSATLWDKKTTMWDFKSCHNPFDSEFYKKYFLRVTMQFKQTTNLSVQPISDADKGRVVANLPIIRSRRLLDWGDSKIDWPTLFYTAKDGNVIDEFRWFKGGSLRSNFRAVELKNAYCVIGASDQMGNINLASLGGGNYTCTLLTAGRKWPLYSVDYYVRIGGTDYIVYQRDSDTVVRINDPLTLLSAPQLNIAFEMWGYPKNEHAHLMSYNVAYEYEGDEEKPYLGVTSLDGGQNA